MKLLELEEPTVTAKMADFLHMDGVCDLLLSFITQLDKGPRPSPQNYDNEGLKLSYKATILITADEPSDALHNFLSKKASVITKRVFDVFQDNSAGSFYHAARVLETLLRMFPAETYTAMTDDGLLEARMNSLLRHIGCVPVADITVMLVHMSPINRQSHLFAMAVQSRWNFILGISKMPFMLRVAEVAADPGRHCWVDGYVTAEEHTNAALQVLQEIVEKYSLEDGGGDILLQPFGYCLELLDLLMNCGLGLPIDYAESSGSAVSGQTTFAATMPRRVYLRCLCYLLNRSSKEEISMYAANPGGQPSLVSMPNKLYPLRPLMLQHLATRMPSVYRVLLTLAAEDGENSDDAADESREGTPSPTSLKVAYPGHVVKKSFSAYRVLLVEFFALMVEADSEVAPQVPLDLWKALIDLVFLYPHNNIYHSMFYRILYAVLRQNDENVLKNILQKSRLVAELFDHFMPYSEEGHAAGPGRGATSETVKKFALRGVITNCANAIRLQMETLPPTSFLHVYLMSHGKWTAFLPVMRVCYAKQQNTGLGFIVPDESKGPGSHVTSMQHLAALFAAKEEPDIDGIEHGSRYAKSLGFEGDTKWPTDSLADTPTKKKKKSKKKVQN
ncbi:unnamed protein product [Ectocarpus fasciculatus]